VLHVIGQGPAICGMPYQVSRQEAQLRAAAECGWTRRERRTPLQHLVFVVDPARALRRPGITSSHLPTTLPDDLFEDPRLLADAPLVGPQDQREIQARPDVLCYTSDLLTSDVEATGPLSVTVRASTSTTAASTDWTAKLVDVWSDGRAISVIDGIVRVVTVPGAVTDHLIDLVATSQVFKAGHRIRVEIASSNFPRFDRNLGTGRTGPDLVVAQQTVYPESWITLPIVPR
jgi:predicted acyl esterase